jgi:hypothetical protein
MFGRCLGDRWHTRYLIVVLPHKIAAALVGHMWFMLWKRSLQSRKRGKCLALIGCAP